MLGKWLVLKIVDLVKSCFKKPNYKITILLHGAKKQEAVAVDGGNLWNPSPYVSYDYRLL